MRTLRTETPPSEEWTEDDIMAHLGCDKPTAEKIMEDCRKRHGLTGYGAIEKHLILDFINEKQRAEREREARYNADISAARQVAVLEEQVRTLQKMCESSSDDARKARFISGISIAVAVIALVLQLFLISTRSIFHGRTRLNPLSDLSA